MLVSSRDIAIEIFNQNKNNRKTRTGRLRTNYVLIIEDSKDRCIVRRAYKFLLDCQQTNARAFLASTLFSFSSWNRDHDESLEVRLLERTFKMQYM